MWKKRYFEEKKRTTPLEERANKLRNELDSLHRRIMSQLETKRERDDGRKLKDNKPSQQVSTKLLSFQTSTCNISQKKIIRKSIMLNFTIYFHFHRGILVFF